MVRRVALLLAALLGVGQVAASPPPYGMNLAPATYSSKEYAFVDLWKTRGATTSPVVDAAGEPTGSDPNVTAAWGLGVLDGQHQYDIMTDGSVKTIGFAGGVVGLKYNAQAMTVSLSGAQTTQMTVDHQGATTFKLRTASPTKVAIVETVNRGLYDAGEIFRPDFVDSVRGFEVLRFMDWNATNNRFASDAPRALLTDRVWSPRVPIEVQAMLANRVGADMWLNIPAGADGGYVVASVTAAHFGLAPELRILLEYSNEIWNGTFKQTPWLNALAAQVKMPPAQMYGLLAGNMAKAASAVAGPGRIKTMLCWQGSAMAGSIDTIMKGWDASGAPRALIEGFCVATYPDLLDADAKQWTAWAKAGDIKSALAYMLSRQAARAAYYPAIATKAKAYGLSWSLYEYNGAGLQTSAPSPIAVADRPMVLAFNEAVAHSPDAVEILKRNRAAFDAAGGAHYVLFNDVGGGSQYGFWGTLGPSSMNLTYPAAPLIRAANDSGWAAMPNKTVGYIGRR